MNLPDDVLQIIKEYSIPVTRPDWRTLHRMTYDTYFNECRKEYYSRILYISERSRRRNPLYLKRLHSYKTIFRADNYYHIFYEN